jgi:hypothetical protein
MKSSHPLSPGPRKTPRRQAWQIARFQHLDVSEGLPEQYDVITTFDVVHDAVNPRGLFWAIQQGLKPGGRCVCLEINSSDKLEENIGLVGACFYSCSVLYCMTASVAGHGEGMHWFARIENARTVRRSGIQRGAACADRESFQHSLGDDAVAAPSISARKLSQQVLQKERTLRVGRDEFPRPTLSQCRPDSYPALQ